MSHAIEPVFNKLINMFNTLLLSNRTYVFTARMSSVIVAANVFTLHTVYTGIRNLMRNYKCEARTINPLLVTICLINHRAAYIDYIWREDYDNNIFCLLSVLIT